MRQWIRWVILVAVVGLIGGVAGWAYAQGAQPAAGVVISGNDVGFRVERSRLLEPGKLSGEWVVRINGQWVVPDTSGTRNLSSR